MGRGNNKKRRTSHVAPPSGGATQATPLNPTATAIPAETRNRYFWIQIKHFWVLLRNSNALSLLALIVSVIAIYYSKRQADIGAEQARISQQSLDIATGKRTAKLEYASFTPAFSGYPKSDYFEVAGTKLTFPFYRDAVSFVTRPPAITVNNVGDEPIDAIKVEISFLGGMINDSASKFDVRKPPKDWHKEVTPIILRKVHREEHVLVKQWLPRQSLRISLVKGVLDQITQVQSKSLASHHHMADLEIGISARLAGSTRVHA